MKLIYSLALFLVFLPLGAMNDPSSYKGTKITSHSIVSLCPAPDKVKLAATQFAEKHIKLLHFLSKRTEDTIVDRQELKAAKINAAREITKAGLINLSTENYTFEIPGKIDGDEYVMKLAGDVNIAINILHNNGYGWELDKLTNALEKSSTYQGPSSCAYYPKAHEEIEKENITFIEVPPTFCVQMPGRPDMTQVGAMDGNCIVIQKKIYNFVPLCNNLVFTEFLTKEKHLAPFVGLIGAAGLWNEGLLYNPATGKLGLTDLEQPNNERKKNFLNQDIDKYQHNITVAAQEVVQRYKAAEKAGYDVAQQIADLKNLFKNSPYFRADKKAIIATEFTK